MIVDLRSDTLTKPTKEMLEAMMTAPVGDDVFGEDPSVNKLQEKMAEMFGMEAALFVPSGTMANQIAIKVHTQPGDEVICDKLSHIYNYEGGGIAFNSGASVRLLGGDNGVFTPEQVEEAILGDDSHLAHTRLVSIENTVNKGGGKIWTIDQIKKIETVCRQHSLGFHLDGARLFNALVESGDRPIEYGKAFDSISICLSKGLGAPIGSVLLGEKSFIKKAHRIRKVMGGGMRQVGYLAKAGSYALDHHINRLKVDHENARKIASYLTGIIGITNILNVESNIVIFELENKNTAKDFLLRLEKVGIIAAPFGPTSIRFVTHLDITEKHMEYLEKTLRSFS